MQYEIVNFDNATGSVDVRFWTEDYPAGLVYRVDVPIVDGQYVTGSELDNLIMAFAPHGQIARILQAKSIPKPADIVVVETIRELTPEEEQQKINAEARAYLQATDWMIIRFLDNGIPVPEDVKASRQAARDLIVEP